MCTDSGLIYSDQQFILRLNEVKKYGFGKKRKTSLQFEKG